jgi:hypothetical protein
MKKCFTQDLQYFTLEIAFEATVCNTFDRNKLLNLEI